MTQLRHQFVILYPLDHEARIKILAHNGIIGESFTFSVDIKDDAYRQFVELFDEEFKKEMPGEATVVNIIKPQSIVVTRGSEALAMVREYLADKREAEQVEQAAIEAEVEAILLKPVGWAVQAVTSELSSDEPADPGVKWRLRPLPKKLWEHPDLAYYYAAARERVEQHNKELHAARVEEERLKAEAENKERLDWIAQKGSKRLRRMVEESIEFADTYLDERLAFEHPQWTFYHTLANRTGISPIANCTESEFNILDKARKQRPNATLRVVTVADPSCNYQKPMECVAAVDEYLNRIILFGVTRRRSRSSKGWA